MTNYSRQELQDDIFRMYSACIESDNNKSKKAPIDIDRLKKLLTGNKYEESDFEAELSYLIESKYFERHANHFIIPTAHGINKIWGGTTNLPLGVGSDNAKNTAGKTEEVLKLSPEFYGIGINFKALLRKIKDRFKK